MLNGSTGRFHRDSRKRREHDEFPTTAAKERGNNPVLPMETSLRKLYAAIIQWLISKIQPLKPGKCECTHFRCSHYGGKYKCKVVFSRKEDMLTACACQLYIADKDDDSGGDDSVKPEDGPTEKEVSDLFNSVAEKIKKIKEDSHDA